MCSVLRRVPDNFFSTQKKLLKCCYCILKNKKELTVQYHRKRIKNKYPRVGLCEQDNQIEGNKWKKKKTKFNFKKN